MLNIGEQPSDFVIGEWSKRAIVEFNSAQLTAQVHQFLSGIGCSTQLIKLGERVIQDELRHARQCLESLQQWGVEVPIAPEQVYLRSELPRLIDPLHIIVSSFVVGETSAVPLFGAMLANATDPSAVQVLQGIVRDEKVHRSFAWKVLDEILLQDASNNRRLLDHCGLDQTYTSAFVYIQDNLARWTGEIYRAFSSGEHDPLLSDTEKQFGLIDGVQYRDIWVQCFHDTVRPQFTARQFDIPTF